MPHHATDPTLPDLSGRRAVVTGASDGIGLCLAQGLAAAGAEVVMPVRDPRKGSAAVDAIVRRNPAATVSLRELDLASLASIGALGAQLREEGTPIDILVNNAGIMTPPRRQVTADGFEMQFGVNFLGHVALVAQLLPLLRAGHARVTSQISIAAKGGSIAWGDLQSERSYRPTKAYNQSKLALGLFGLELDRRSREGGWGIVSNLAHPGIAPTGLLDARPELGRPRQTRGRRVIGALSRRGILFGTADSAALPALHAATSPEATGGSFYGPRGFGHVGGGPAEQKLYATLRPRADAERLWSLAQELTAAAYPHG